MAALNSQKMSVIVLSHYINVMLEEKNKGGLTSNSFSKTQFQAFSDSINERCHVLYSVKALQTKFHRMRKQWRQYHDLRENRTGVGHDPATGAILASEEQWDEWIKGDDTLKVFRTKGLVHYEQLTELFMTTTASGDFGRSMGDVPANSDEERDIENMFRTPPMPRSRFGQGNEAGTNRGIRIEEGGSSRQSGKRPVDSGTQSSGGRSSKKSREESFDQLLEAWTNKQKVQTSMYEQYPTLDECMEILNTMDIPDDDFYVKATNYLRDPDSRVIFKRAMPRLRIHLIQSSFPPAAGPFHPYGGPFPPPTGPFPPPNGPFQ